MAELVATTRLILDGQPIAAGASFELDDEANVEALLAEGSAVVAADVAPVDEANSSPKGRRRKSSS